MKLLALGVSLALAAPAAASSYQKANKAEARSGARALSRTSKTLGAGFGTTGQAPSHAAAPAHASAPAASHGALGSTKGLAPATSAVSPADSVPGWLANPQPGALIRTAGMGYKISDGGPTRLNIDYQHEGWGSAIAMDERWAFRTTGYGVRMGPPDTPPYPYSRGGAGSGAGGNGIFGGPGQLGLDASGNTVQVK